MRSATGTVVQQREVEPLDGFLDQALVVTVVEHLARDLLGRDQREVCHLGADLLERTLGLGLDQALGLVEPALTVGLGFLSRPLALGVCDAARLAADAIGAPPCLAAQLAVLPEPPLRPLARLAAVF